MKCWLSLLIVVGVIAFVLVACGALLWGEGANWSFNLSALIGTLTGIVTVSALLGLIIAQDHFNTQQKQRKDELLKAEEERIKVEKLSVLAMRRNSFDMAFQSRFQHFSDTAESFKTTNQSDNDEFIALFNFRYQVFERADAGLMRRNSFLTTMQIEKVQKQFPEDWEHICDAWWGYQVTVYFPSLFLLGNAAMDLMRFVAEEDTRVAIELDEIKDDNDKIQLQAYLDHIKDTRHFARMTFSPMVTHISFYHAFHYYVANMDDSPLVWLDYFGLHYRPFFIPNAKPDEVLGTMRKVVNKFATPEKMRWLLGLDLKNDDGTQKVDDEMEEYM